MHIKSPQNFFSSLFMPIHKVIAAHFLILQNCFLITVGSCFFCVSPQAIAQSGNSNKNESKKNVGVIKKVLGKATLLRLGKSIDVRQGLGVLTSDVLVTFDNSTVMLQFIDGSNIVAFDSSSLKISAYMATALGEQESVQTVIDAIRGKIRFFFRKTNAVIRTENSTIGVRGTTFVVSAYKNATEVELLEGVLRVAQLGNSKNFVTLSPRQKTTSSKTMAPTKPVAMSPTRLNEIVNIVKPFEGELENTPHYNSLSREKIEAADPGEAAKPGSNPGSQPDEIPSQHPSQMIFDPSSSEVKTDAESARAKPSDALKPVAPAALPSTKSEKSAEILETFRTKNNDKTPSGPQKSKIEIQIEKPKP